MLRPRHYEDVQFVFANSFSVLVALKNVLLINAHQVCRGGAASDVLWRRQAEALVVAIGEASDRLGVADVEVISMMDANCLPPRETLPIFAATDFDSLENRTSMFLSYLASTNQCAVSTFHHAGWTRRGQMVGDKKQEDAMLDYITATQSAVVTVGGVMQELMYAVESDHLPIYATICLSDKKFEKGYTSLAPLVGCGSGDYRRRQNERAGECIVRNSSDPNEEGSSSSSGDGGGCSVQRARTCEGGDRKVSWVVGPSRTQSHLQGEPHEVAQVRDPGGLRRDLAGHRPPDPAAHQEGQESGLNAPV